MRVLDIEGGALLVRIAGGLEGSKKLEELPYCPWNVYHMSGFCWLGKSSPALSCYRFLFTSSGNAHDYKYSSEFWEWFWSYDRVMWISDAEFGKDETVLIPVTTKVLKIIKSEMKGKRCLGDVFPSLGESTFLAELVIEKCSKLKYIMSGTYTGTCICAPVLVPLEKLCLQGLPHLKRIVKFGGCSFYNLKTLTIKNCSKVKDVVQLNNNQMSLPTLTNLQVWDCEEVEQIFGSNNDTKPNPVLVLPKLRCLVLFNLPKLESIYKGLLCFTSHAIIESCPKLKVLEVIGGFEKVICDSSSSTLASISNGNAKGWWENLYKDYPKSAYNLS